MAPKPGKKPSGESTAVKQHRKGFRVGPDNLPDGAWKRKVTKIKKDLIHKAKVKKAYAKIKEREQQPKAEGHAVADAPDAGDDADDDGAASAKETMHPTRELMIKDEEVAQNSAQGGERDATSDGHRRRTRRPGYYDKQLAKAEERRAEGERRREEHAARMAERDARIAEREKFKRAMAKTVGRDGKKKLGRESGILLDKVRKMVANK